MSKLRELYESKKFEEFKLTINKEILAINELIKVIYGDTACFDDKGFITHYKSSNVIYEYDVEELTYKLGIKIFGELLTETYFHNFLFDYDFDKLKEGTSDVDLYIQLDGGEIGKDYIITKSTPYSLGYGIFFNESSKNSVEKTDLCIPNFDKEDKLPSIVHKSLINNNLFYRVGNELVLICEKDIRLVSYEYHHSSKIVIIGDKKMSLVSGEIL